MSGSRLCGESRALHIAVTSLVLLGIPTAAFANIVFPSVVQWISAAGPYTILLIPSVVTLPLLITISLIEALIVRVALKPNLSLARLVVILFVVNSITSAIGLVTMPNGTELFPGLILAFIATSLIEGACLVMVYPRAKRRISMSLFKVSLLMNGASYLFLGALLAGLIYLPSATMPDNLDREKLSGQLVILDYNDKPQSVVALPSGKTRMVSPTFHLDSETKYKVAFIKGQRWIIDIATGKRIGKIDGGPYHDGWQISDDGRYYANYLYGSDTVVVGDAVENSQKHYQHIHNIILHSKSARVALQDKNGLRIIDLRRKQTRKVKQYGRIDVYREMAWSPDGKYIAYPADISPFTQMIGEASPNAIRVVSTDGKSATVARDADSIWRCGGLSWLPKSH